MHKPTSPNFSALLWKMSKGDNNEVTPMIRNQKGQLVIHYTNGCHKDYNSDWLHRGLLHSFWQWEILVWNLVFISLQVLFSHRYVISIATSHIFQSFTKNVRWSFLLFQDGVNSAWSFPSSPNYPYHLSPKFLNQAFVTLEMLGKQYLFCKEETGRGHRGRRPSQEGPRESCLVTVIHTEIAWTLFSNISPVKLWSREYLQPFLQGSDKAVTPKCRTLTTGSSDWPVPEFKYSECECFFSGRRKVYFVLVHCEKYLKEMSET